MQGGGLFSKCQTESVSLAVLSWTAGRAKIDSFDFKLEEENEEILNL